MSVSQQAGTEDPASVDTAATGTVDQQVQLLLQAIGSDDGETIATEIDRLGELLGPAAAAPILAGLAATGLTDKMLATLTSRAKTNPTALGWTQLASAAAIVGRDDLAVEAASTALKIEPGSAGAALVLVVAANRRGDHDEALRVIADLVARVPAAKDEPFFILQTALAEIGRNQPEAALASVDAALPRLTAAGLEFDALVLRARALGAITGRSEDAVSAWESALAGARYPGYVDYARGGLIAALRREKRYDESLHQLELAIAGTYDPHERTALNEVRVQLLAEKGDIDGALAASDDLLSSTTNPQDRVRFRLEQAGIVAMTGRWKDAAERFDGALAEVPKDAAETSNQRHAIQMRKAQTLGPHEIDLVLADLDELDTATPADEWPVAIDVRVGGLIAAGRPAEALEWLDARVARTPTLGDHPAVHQLRAEIELKLGHTDEAMVECRRAVDLAATAADPRGLGAVLMCAHGSQQWEAAIDAYDRLGKLDPTSAFDPSARTIAAVAYLRNNQPEKALRLTDDAQAIAPNMRALRDMTRAEAQVRLRRYDEALATTAAALDRSKATPSTEIPAEFLLSLHLVSAQAFFQQAKFVDALAATTAAIDVPDQSDPALPGLIAFARLGALVQRSLVLYRLKRMNEAQDDIDRAITGFEVLRHSAIVKVMRSPEFERFESGLWYAKGQILEVDESCSEEALAAYTRADRLEKQGSAAAIARGYALAGISAFNDAMASFDTALRRASSPREKASAVAGKGRVLVHLGKFEDAITMLHNALDTRLDEPDNDPVVFEALGIAYNALHRYPAARRAFLRAWTLSEVTGRSVNLALGVTSAELCLGKPKAALDFLDKLPSHLAEEHPLKFNRALALAALGHRRSAIKCLLKLKDAGLREAQRELDRLDVPAGLGLWSRYWLGIQARPAQRMFGITLLVIAAPILLAPLFQWWLLGKVDWYLLLLPSLVALLLFALPNMKSITMGLGDFKVSAEPLSATDNDAATASLILPSMVPPTGPAPEFSGSFPGSGPGSTTEFKVPALDLFSGVAGLPMPLSHTMKLM